MKQFAAAAERNKVPIVEVLAEVLPPPPALVLEVASGTGEHAVFFAGALPHLVFQPTEPGERNRASIAAWRDQAALGNLRPPLALDAIDETWPIERADAVLCINMIHIAPWAACLGLLAGAARVLPAGGALVLYGPFRRGGRHTSPSNEAFDASLREKDPAWGVRDLDEVVAAAASRGLALDEAVDMPSNNLTVVLRRAPPIR